MRSLLDKTFQSGNSENSQNIIRLDPSVVRPQKITKRNLAMVWEEEEEPEEGSKVCQQLPGEKTFNCKICSLFYQSFKSLQSHNHAKHRRHTCKLCHGTFSMRSNLRRHELLHAGVKPFKCDVCQKAYPRREMLQGHMKTHHGGVAGSRNDKTGSQANKVGSHGDKTAFHDKEYGSHGGEARSHGDKAVFHGDQAVPQCFNCSHCPKAFQSNSGLVSHLLAVHNTMSNIYLCRICDRVFPNRGGFLRHRAYTHPTSHIQIGRRHRRSGPSTDSQLPKASGVSVESAQTNRATEENVTCQDKPSGKTHDTYDFKAMSTANETTPSQRSVEMMTIDNTNLVNMSLVKQEPRDLEEMTAEEMEAAFMQLPDEMPGSDNGCSMLPDEIPGSDNNGAVFSDEMSGSDNNGAVFSDEMSGSDNNGAVFSDEMPGSDNNGAVFSDEMSGSDNNGAVFSDEMPGSDNGCSMLPDEMPGSDNGCSMLPEEMPGSDNGCPVNVKPDSAVYSVFPIAMVEDPGTAEASPDFDQPLVIDIVPTVDQEVDSNTDSHTAAYLS